MESMDAVVTRSQTKLYLIDQPVSELSNVRLASNGEVLGLFFHLHVILGQSIRPAATSVIKQVVTIWNRARIPTCRKDHAIVKLEKLHKEWKNLKRHINRKSELQAVNEESFCTKMNNLFDIAHADALKDIRIQEDRDFLLAQREPGRRGYMVSVDKVLTGKEERKARRIELQKIRRERAQNEASTSRPMISAVDSIPEEEEDHCVSLTDTDNDVEFQSPVKKKTRATVNVITPQLAAALDRTKMSDRMATFVLGETAHSRGHTIDDLNMNRSSIKRQREKHRAAFAAALKTEFSANDASLVVHWDGKLMADLSGNVHIDRLPVIVTTHGVAQLLKVSKMPGGTGEHQSSAVVQALDECNLQHRVVGMCFDTTSLNTGRHSGACVQIEHKLGRDLLYLACRTSHYGAVSWCCI